MLGLADRNVLITGVAGAIGSASARRLVREGARVIGLDTDSTGLDALTDELGSQRFLGIPADVTDRSSVSAAFERAGQVGPLNAVFINAGVEGRPHLLQEFDEAEYRRVFDVNVLGSFHVAAAALGALAEGGGKLVLMASTAGLTGGALGTGIYVASKHAVVGIGRALAVEAQRVGIQVTVLCPGPVESRMMDDLGAGVRALVAAGGDEAAGLSGGMDRARYATADEIAAEVAWLFSDEVPLRHGEIVALGGSI